MDAKSRQRRPPYALRVLRSRPRLAVSTLVAALAAALLPAEWPIARRLVIGWDVGVGLYLILAYRLMTRAQVSDIRKHSAMEDEGQLGVLILTVAAALASLGAIVVELASTPAHGPGRHPAQLVIATLTILLSWAFTHTIFALHYAHEFYSVKGKGGCGLTFPGGEDPDYWDFVYFSFVIGMTSQVSDVAVACKPIRRTVTAHGIVSFVFNAALLALTVNIAASAI